jgi:hypothetical protein
MKKFAGLLLVFLSVDGARLISAPAEKDDAPDFYPLKVGTKWHYRVTAGEQGPVQIINQIAKIEKIDDQSLARLECNRDGKVTATEHLASTSKGIFRHRTNGIESSPPICLLRYPVKKDDSWNSETTVGEEKGKVTCTVLDDKAEIEVPAGKYTAVCVKVEIKTKDNELSTTYWFVAGVGMVKQTVELGKTSVKLELEKVEKPK